MKNDTAGNITYSQRKRVPIHAYRLVYPDSPHATEMLWEWERPFIDRLLWNATTFGRQVAQRYFADWHALAAENQRIWERDYPWPAYAPWEGWQRWMAEHRTLVATVQEVYEAQYGRRRAGRLPARQDVQERDIKPDITGA